MDIRNHYIKITLLYLLCVAIQLILFKGYMYRPNELAFVFGGDGMVIYYDMVFHTCYGNGFMLDAMNYPHGEMIFLTDAQGSFSVILNWVNHNLFEICDYVPGIMHAIIMYLMPLCAVFLYLILKHLNVTDWLAIIFSILIAYLSPQLMRLGGHFGLTYIFIIPFTFWWIIRKLSVPKWEKRDILFFLVQVFFFLNNPYIGFMTTGILCLSGIYLIYVFRLRRFAHFRTGIYSLMVGLSAVLLVYGILKSGDPFDDRLSKQWGFFHYHASIEGFFIPPFSLWYKILSTVIEVKAVPFESWINLGFVTSLILLAIISTSIIKRRKPAFWPSGRFNEGMKALVFATIVLFIYASNSTFLGFLQPFAEKHLSPLLMFKASARFAWPLFYLLNILVVLWINDLFQRRRFNFPTLSVMLLTLIILIWAVEDYHYIKDRYTKNFYENPYSADNKNAILSDLESAHIDISDYQAMYALPIMQAWTDKLIAPLHFNTQYYGMRLSAATGLPMINAMLSRMSISHTLESTQMVAHPTLTRSLLSNLPERKPILLILGSDHPPLKEGEAFILSLSKELLKTRGYSLYRLDPGTLENAVRKEQQKIKTRLSEEFKNSDHHLPHIRLNMDDGRENGLFGNGALLIPEGVHTIMDTLFPLQDTTAYSFSVWHKVTSEKYGLPRWKLILQNEQGGTLSTFENNMKYSRDIHQGWLRASIRFTPEIGTKRIGLIVETNQESVIDEILIRPDHKDVLIEENGLYYYNNFIFE